MELNLITNDSELQSLNIKGYTIQFVLKSNKKDIPHLIVLFNGYRKSGWDFNNSINFFKCNVLMICDIFKDRQSCYLGDNQNFNFSECINILIGGFKRQVQQYKNQT